MGTRLLYRARDGQNLLLALDGARAGEADLLEECSKHIARYKLPKAFCFMDEIVRSPSGKADYRWARAQVS